MATTNEKVKEAMKKAEIARRQPSQVDIMCARLSSPALIKSITAALPSAIEKDAERFSRNLMTLMRLTPQLATCTPATVMGGALTGAAMGLDPTPGMNEFYLTPFKNNKTGVTEAQFILGYKGMQTLLYRGGCKKVIAREVREKDTFEISYGYEDTLTHKPPIKGERGDVIGYYAAVILPSGEKSFLYMTKEEIVHHASNRSRAYKFGPWQTDFGAMAKKTCLRQLFPWLPKDVRAQQAEMKDGGVIKVDDAGDRTYTSDEILDITADQPIEFDAQSEEAENRSQMPSTPADEETQAPHTEKKALPTLEERMDLILGDEGLDLTAEERERFIADTLGISCPITENFRTEKNIKAVIAAANALLQARER